MNNKRKIFKGADIAVIAITLTVVVFSVIAGAIGVKTERIVYSIVVDSVPEGAVSPGDSVINLEGGKLGTVVSVGENSITVEADVKVFSGNYYAGGTVIKNDEKYNFAVNAYHMKGTVRDLNAKENKE